MRSQSVPTLRTELLKPKFCYADFHRREVLVKVADHEICMSWGSFLLLSLFKPSQHVDMVGAWCYFPSMADGKVSKREAIFCPSHVDGNLCASSAIFSPWWTEK